MRILVVASAVAFTVVLGFAMPVLGAEPVLKPIQPGAGLGFGTPGFCTQGFLFRDAFDWYGSTAAHCVDMDELLTNNEAGVFFGRVVVDDDDELPGGLDFALFRIFPAQHGLINPAVRHWGGPTGIGTPATNQAGDVVLHFGTPLGLGYGYPAQVSALQNAQARTGLFESYFDGNLHFAGATAQGDSGSPVISNKDGRALGLNAHVGNFHFTSPVTATNDGPSVQTALARMQSVYGFSLTLQTAPFTPAVIEP